MTTPVLSILVPTFNRCEFIKYQIKTFVDEGIIDDPFYEILVSNNCSEDGTYEFLKELSASNVIVYNQNSNIGGVSNIKFLLSKATGDYLWVIGDDDQLLKGCFEKVREILTKEKNIEHIFVNHKYKKNGTVVNKNVINCNDGIYDNGLKMFEELAPNNKCFFGACMFITANIYSRTVIDETLKIIEENKENENLAFPLGFAVLSSRGRTATIGDAYIVDRFDGTTWSYYSDLVSFRDMIAMYDIVAATRPEYKRLLDLYVKYNSEKYPEYRYIKCEKKYGIGNYAWELYKKHYPMKLVTDLFYFPRGIRNLLFKLLGLY